MSLSKAFLKKPPLQEVFESLIQRLVYLAEDALDESSDSTSSTGSGEGNHEEGDSSPPAAHIPANENESSGSSDGDEELIPFCQKTLGLASPLWWWTHRAAPNGGVSQSSTAMPPTVVAKHSPSMCQREAKMIFHLLQWLKLQPGGRKESQQFCGAKPLSPTTGVASRLSMKSVKVLTTQDVLTHLDVIVREKQEENGVKPADLLSREDFFSGAELIQLRSYSSALLHADWDYQAVNKRKVPPLGSKLTLPEEKVATSDDRSYCSVAIWALGTLSASQDGVENLSGDVGEYGSAFLHQAQEAAIVISDAGWINATIPWQGMRIIREKLKEIHPLRTDDIQGGLFGPGLPIVCPMHPTLSRTTVSGVESFNGFCRQLSLQPYSCGQPGHICVELCHMTSGKSSAQQLTKCPYLCSKKLSCGHPCKVECSAPCNCLKIKEVERPCSHQEIESYDPETNEPRYVTVVHKVKGVCCQDLLSLYPNCTVKVPTFCRTCNDQFLEAECHEVARASKEGGMQCKKCSEKYSTLRKELRVQVITETLKKKEELVQANRKAFLEQTRNANKGLFKDGQIVRITSFEGYRDSQEDHETVPFDQWYDGELGALTGQQCTVIGPPFFEGDEELELQYCVKLHATAGMDMAGKYVMMANSGLALVQALTAGPGGANGASGGPLMITAGAGHQPTAPPADSGAAPVSATTEPPSATPVSAEGDAAPPASAVTYENLPALGQIVHIHTSIVVPVVEEVQESEVDPSPIQSLLRFEEATLPSLIAKVIGHQSEDSLHVEFTTPRSTADYQADCAAFTSYQSGAESILPYRTFRTTVPAAAVSALFPQGQRVVVINSQETQCVSLQDKQMTLAKHMYHVSGPEEVSGVDLQDFYRQTNGSILPLAAKKKSSSAMVPLPALTNKDLEPARLGFEAACVVVGFCNPPLSQVFPEEKREEGNSGVQGQPTPVQNLSQPGPYYVLRAATIKELNDPKSSSKKVKTHAEIDGRTVGKKDNSRASSKIYSPTSSAADLNNGHKITLVSIQGVSQDAQYEAEKVMAVDAREELEKRTQSAFEQWLEEEKVKNLEKTIRKKEELEKKQATQRKLEALRAKRNGGAAAVASESSNNQKTKIATVGQLFTSAEVEKKEADYITWAARDKQELETARKLHRKAQQNSKTGEDEQWQQAMEAHQKEQHFDDEYFKQRAHQLPAAGPSVRVGGVITPVPRR